MAFMAMKGRENGGKREKRIFDDRREKKLKRGRERPISQGEKIDKFTDWWWL